MTTKTPDELTQEIERLKAERDTYRTLSGVGTWHNDCRPNRQMAARELEKSQAVIDKLADTITELKAQLTALSAPSLSPAVQAVVEAWKSLRNEELRIWGKVEIDHAGRCGAQTNALMKACEQLAAVHAEHAGEIARCVIRQANAADPATVFYVPRAGWASTHLRFTEGVGPYFSLAEALRRIEEITGDSFPWRPVSVPPEQETVTPSVGDTAPKSSNNSGGSAA